jgi:hypothetical protein
MIERVRALTPVRTFYGREAPRWKRRMRKKAREIMLFINVLLFIKL